MNVRRSAAALAISAALCATAVATAPAASAIPAAPADDAKRAAGPYGTKDPKFDGVWRQSLALLAQDATGVKPANSAIAWLAGQQCADGGFAAYRADTGKACDPKKGEFTDATSAAIQALAAVGGRSAAVDKGIGWLKHSQNEDGGWGMNPGGTSDANSTSAAVGAFAAAGMDPVEVAAAASGKTPYDALLGLQLDCSAKAGQRGAFAYTSGKGEPAANDLATVSAALATRGSGFVFDPVGKDGHKSPKPLKCEGNEGNGGADRAPEDASEAALAYLSTTMSDNGMHLKSATPGAAKAQPDFGATADAIMALAAGEHSAAAARPLQWLQGKDSGAAAWAKGDPGALAKLVLAAHAAGADPRHFGDADLVQQLNATGPAPVEQQASEKKSEKDDNGGTGSVWWIVGSCAVAGMGIGFLFSGRKRQRV